MYIHSIPYTHISDIVHKMHTLHIVQVQLSLPIFQPLCSPESTKLDPDGSEDELLCLMTMMIYPAHAGCVTTITNVNMYIYIHMYTYVVNAPSLSIVRKKCSDCQTLT